MITYIWFAKIIADKIKVTEKVDEQLTELLMKDYL